MHSKHGHFPQQPLFILCHQTTTLWYIFNVSYKICYLLQKISFKLNYTNNIFFLIKEPFILLRQDDKAAREFISLIVEAVKEKHAAILASSNFMTLLIDSSQARKTGSEKEMILIRTERAGKQTFSME